MMAVIEKLNAKISIQKVGSGQSKKTEQAQTARIKSRVTIERLIKKRITYSSLFRVR